MSDFIGDFLTRIRNAQKAGHEGVTIPTSNLTTEIAAILKEEGFIENFKLIEDGAKKSVRIQLKYLADKSPAIQKIARLSKPGLRRYTGSSEIPKTLGGLGISILSTSKGLLSDKNARSQKLGGELICEVY